MRKVGRNERLGACLEHQVDCILAEWRASLACGCIILREIIILLGVDEPACIPLSLSK